MLKSLGRFVSLKKTKNFATLSQRSFSSYQTKVEGQFGSKEWKLSILSSSGGLISPWHHIPLKAAEKNGAATLNYVNEIPKGTTSKMEINTKGFFNPIVQDIKKGNLRYFNYGKIPFNYGALPQTWENPCHIDAHTGCSGDNDPVDVVEVSNESIGYGSVQTVKVIGILAMIDEGETDWKVLAISSASPLFNLIHDERTLNIHLPGKLDIIRDWFISYKVPDGKPENVLAFDGQLKDASFASKIINQTHQEWQTLVDNKQRYLLDNRNKAPGQFLWLP